MSDDHTVQERVEQVIADEMGADPNTLRPETRIFEDLSGDSLDEISLTVALEDEFGIEISDRDARQLLTVKDICDYVERRVAREAVTQ